MVQTGGLKTAVQVKTKYKNMTAEWRKLTLEGSIVSDVLDLPADLPIDSNIKKKRSLETFNGNETPVKKPRENNKRELLRRQQSSSAAEVLQERNCVGCDVKPGTLKIVKSKFMADIFQVITGIQTGTAND